MNALHTTDTVQSRFCESYNSYKRKEESRLRGSGLRQTALVHADPRVRGRGGAGPVPAASTEQVPGRGRQGADSDSRALMFFVKGKRHIAACLGQGSPCQPSLSLPGTWSAGNRSYIQEGSLTLTFSQAALQNVPGPCPQVPGTVFLPALGLQECLAPHSRDKALRPAGNLKSWPSDVV